jgi:hypothetical protein
VSMFFLTPTTPILTDQGNIMAQIARTTGSKTAETGKVMVARAADTARDMADQSRDTTLRVVQETASTAEAVAGRQADAAQHLAAVPTQAAKMLQAEGNPARFWLELIGEQMTQNIAVMSRLATTRDWREAVAIQQALARDSLARMNQGMSRSMGLGGRVMARLLAAGRAG